jgi:hypothetical protein
MRKKTIALLTAAAFALTLGMAYAGTKATTPASNPGVKSAACLTPKGKGGHIMKLFMDTHDKRDGTFPASITPEQLNEFYAGYAKACREEGVVIVRTYVSTKEGRAFCLNMAPSVEAIKKAHEKAGLPYDSITEVNGVAPTDLLMQ